MNDNTLPSTTGLAIAAGVCLLGAALLAVILLAGCQSAPDVQVQRAWGTGGVELTIDGTPVFLEVEEAGVQVEGADGPELASCTSVVASIAGAVAEGLVTHISDERCVTDAGLVPFGIRRVLLVRAPAPASTGPALDE